MKDNIYNMEESSESFYGIPAFIKKTQEEKLKGSEGIIPGIYTTDVDFNTMSEEKGKLSKFLKDEENENRYTIHVRNLTVYTALLLQYIGGMLRKYFEIQSLSGFLKSKLAESLNNCDMTYEILRTIDEGDDGKGNMCLVR